MRSPTSCGDVANDGASAITSFATMTNMPRSSHSSDSCAVDVGVATVVDIATTLSITP
jgi:hypothetical protein